MKSEMQSHYALLDETALTTIEAQAAQILDEVGVELQGDPQSLDAMASVGARIRAKECAQMPMFCAN